MKSMALKFCFKTCDAMKFVDDDDDDGATINSISLDRPINVGYL